MAIQLQRLFADERDVPLGEGVSVRIKPITYARMKAAEAAALKTARARMEDAVAAAEEALEAEDRLISYADDIMGLAEEIMLDALVMEFGVSWSGVCVEGPEGEDVDADLTLANWIRFREGCPFLADVLSEAFKAPHRLADAEGNG